MPRALGTGVLAALASFYIWLVLRTTRWTVGGDDDGRKALNGPGRVIAVSWHGRLFLSPSYAPKNRRSVALISRSRDGDLFAAVVRRWGVVAVRGSTYDRPKRRGKGGAAAFTAALRELTRNEAVIGITPDGPRGPRRRVQPGAARLACAARAPVVAVAFSVSRGLVLGGWDRFLLPFPFGRGTVVYGTPRHPPQAADRQSVVRFSEMIEADLDHVTSLADALSGRMPAESV